MSIYCYKWTHLYHVSTDGVPRWCCPVTFVQTAAEVQRVLPEGAMQMRIRRRKEVQPVGTRLPTHTIRIVPCYLLQHWEVSFLFGSKWRLFGCDFWAGDTQHSLGIKHVYSWMQSWIVLMCLRRSISPLKFWGTEQRQQQSKTSNDEQITTHVRLLVYIASMKTVCRKTV